MDGSIVVGIGGAGGWQALSWAVDEAEQTGARLVLLHACALGSPWERITGEPTQAEIEVIDPPLARAYARARTRLGESRIVLRVRTGEPAVRLVDASAAVRLLVIGAGEGGRTVRRVLRHAHGPVVVTRPVSPPSWEVPFGGHVVVGVDGMQGDRAALAFAFGHAAGHRLPLAAVHVSEVSRDDYFYDDTTLSTHFAVEPAALDLLATATEPGELRCPAVPVRRAVLHGSVADALIRAGVGARLLVIGDKRRGVIGRARTGDVPLTVAAEAPCPVAIVPADRREGDRR